MRASPRCNVVELTVVNVILGMKSAGIEKCKERNVKNEEWPTFSMDGILVTMRRHKEESVWARVIRLELCDVAMVSKRFSLGDAT